MTRCWKIDSMCSYKNDLVDHTFKLYNCLQKKIVRILGKRNCSIEGRERKRREWIERRGISAQSDCIKEKRHIQVKS